MTSEAITAMAPRIGTRTACKAAGVPRASWYRRHRASPAPPRRPLVPHRDRAQPRALAAGEQQAILDALHSPRFADLAPAETWAILLDEGVYLGSQSTFYRLLRAAGETRERGRAGSRICWTRTPVWRRSSGHWWRRSLPGCLPPQCPRLIIRWRPGT